MTYSPIIYNRRLVFVRWTHAPRSLLFALTVAVSGALLLRPAFGVGQEASALWDAWPHTVAISPFALKHEELRTRLAAVGARYPGLFAIAEEGDSAEGRKIPLLVAGGGPTTVLLWSQMHGDEPTATSALLDVLEHLGRTKETPDTRRLLSRLTLAIIPMLNPDGAARTRRTNAQGIDVNRDALRLQSPEGRFLKSVCDRLKPSVGYNLHNHDPNVRAGKAGPQVAISLLSVPFDDAFTVNDGRRTTMRMAVLVERLLEPWAKHRVARYDMEYTARAFGDWMTRSGTPTLLIESGGFFGPDEANTLVRLNFVALLGTLHALADGSLAKVDFRAYDAIPLNTRDRLFDVLVRNARVVGGGGLPPYLADVGVNVASARPGFSGPSLRGRRVGVVEVGDLTDFLGKTEIALDGRLLVVAPPGGEDGWKKALAGLAGRGLATANGVLTLSESALSAEAKAWLGGAAPLAPGYGGDFLVLGPAGKGGFRVERRISPLSP
ncbi:MAG TPA: M14 family zinc carboxypeptidase [Thermoanaerobaculia bacterium]|nr:M14 family zinc carboxypeptidase [Thermoanaerobaculia bacterium]